MQHVHTISKVILESSELATRVSMAVTPPVCIMIETAIVYLYQTCIPVRHTVAVYDTVRGNRAPYSRFYRRNLITSSDI